MIEFLSRIEPEEMGITCKWIVSGMAVAIAAMAAYIVKLQVQKDALQNDWAQYMRQQAALAQTLKDELLKPKGGP